MGDAGTTAAGLLPVYTASAWRCPVSVAELREHFTPTVKRLPARQARQCVFFDGERFAGVTVAEYAGDHVAALRLQSAGTHTDRDCRFGGSPIGGRGFAMNCRSKNGAFYTAVFMPDKTHTWILAAAVPISEPASYRLRAIVDRLLTG
jgi:hypothetical protein